MTVQLASLRVGAEMDASNYTRGMGQKVAADKAGAASSREVGAAITATDTKVNSAGDILTKLSRRYVDGFGTAQTFNKAVRDLGRGMDTGNVSMAQAGTILDGLYRKLGLTANAEELAANGQLSLARAVSAANERIELQTVEQAALARAAANTNIVLGQQGVAHGSLGRAIGLNRGQLQNLSFQANDVISGLMMGQKPMQIFTQQAGQIVQILSMSEGGLGGALAGVGGMLAASAPLIAAAAGALAVAGLGFAALTSEVDRATGKNISFAQVFVAVWQTIADGVMGVGKAIWGTVKPAMDALTGWFGDLVHTIAPGVKTATNAIIGGFVFAFEYLVDEWSMLPAAFGDITIQAANVMVGGIETMINNAVHLLNELIAKVNSANIAGISLGIKPVGDVSFGQIQNPFAGAGSNFASTEMGKAKDALGRDYAGDLFGNISDHAVTNFNNDNKPKDDDAKGGGRTVREKQSDYDKELKSIQDKTAALTIDTNVVGLSTFAAAKLSAQMELENAARKDAIGLTPERVKQIDAESTAYANMTAQLEQTKIVYDTLKGAFTGFFDDLKSNLKDGQTFWEAFGSAAANALDKIANKALDMAANGIFDMLWGAGMSAGSSGGGGILGSIVSGVLGMFGGGGGSGTAGNFSIGTMATYANGTSSAAGGLALVGERGPEIVNMPRGAQVFDNQRSMSMLAANGNGPMHFTYAPVYGNIQGGTSQEIADLKQQIAQDRSNFELRVQRAVRDPRSRAA